MVKNVEAKYLICTDRDLEWGLSVQDVGFQSVNGDSPYPPVSKDLNIHPKDYLFRVDKGRILDEYQLVYIVRGAGEFYSESSGEQPLKAGDMILLFPGERHNYKPSKKSGWDEFWIGFRGANIDTRVAKGFFTREKPIYHPGIKEDIVNIYNIAIRSAENQHVGYQQMLAGCVNMLLGYIHSINTYQSVFEGLEEESMQKALLYIRQNIDNDIHPEQVAEHINWGYSNFRKVFKNFTGRSPYQYIQELKIMKSKELLLNTTLTLAEIASVVSIGNPDYFSTVFKRYCGVTPSQYRNSH